MCFCKILGDRGRYGTLPSTLDANSGPRACVVAMWRERVGA